MRARANSRKAPSRRFSSTVNLGNRRRPSGTSEIPMPTISWVLWPIRSYEVPSMVATMRPPVGRTCPMMHFIRVLFPLPLVPRRTTVSPPRTPMLTPESTRTPPYPACRSSMAMLFAKVSLFDLVLPHDLIRKSVGDLAARDYHHDALREHHHGPHNVFNEEDRNSPGVEPVQESKDFIDFALRKTCHHLVGNQDFRSRGKRPAEFELPQFDLGQAFRAEIRLPAKSNLIEDQLCRFADGARRCVPDRKPQRHLDVLLHSQSAERPRDLIGPGQPVLRPLPCRRCGDIVAIKGHRSMIRSADSRKAVYERTLARSVRADQAYAFSLRQRKVEIVEGHESAEPLRNARRLEDIRGHLRLRFQLRTIPTTPLGAIVKKTTSNTPTMKRFAADDIVTVRICWADPRRTAPTTGPHQAAVPPTNGMAMEFTAIARLKAVAGST